jgi:hypothetical protein
MRPSAQGLVRRAGGGAPEALPGPEKYFRLARKANFSPLYQPPITWVYLG